MQSSREIPDAVAAATFWRLVSHLQHRTEVQNVDLMAVSGFCRNCLSKWLAEIAAENGEQIDKETAREAIYGMPYEEWKARFQTEATPEQLRRMDESVARNSA